MADGIWTMHDDGTFEIQEPYKTMLEEAKVAATRAWTAGLIEYLEPRCPYTAQFLADELVRRNKERNDGPLDRFDEFVLEALSGDL